MKWDMAKESLEWKGCEKTTQIYKQNLEDNFEPYETKCSQLS